MRISAFQKEIAGAKIDCALIFSLDEEPNKSMIYLTGYSGLGILAVLKDKCFILAPEMEYEKAKKTKLPVFKSDKKHRLLDNLSSLLAHEKIDTLGIEYNKCSYLLYKKIKKALKKKRKDTSALLAKMCMVKDDIEIKNIKKACDVTDKIFKTVCKNFKFKTEMELKCFIEDSIRKNGCELAFPAIVASGKGTSLPHYVPTDKKIVNGFLMLDFGARYNGYCADMTRMLYVGNPKKEELEDYSLVLNAVKKCEAASLKKRSFQSCMHYLLKT
jgi:Xaa-Pro aminopeptidase